MKLSPLRGCAAIIIALCFTVLFPAPARGYVEVPYTLGRIVAESTNILLLRVESVDRERNAIIYKKIRDIKGTHPGDTVKHNIGKAGFHPREWQTIMAWAETGKTALFFHNNGASETCIDGYWYQAYPGEWWSMSHAEPYLLRTYAGRPERLASAVEQMIAGQEVTVPCMIDGDKNAIQMRTAKVQRMKASLKIQDYDAKRDFAGWGVEEFKIIRDMRGFTHYAALTRVDPRATGIAPADFDGDGRVDFCLYGESRLSLMQNAGQSTNEVRLPGIEGGARAAVWSDCNGDKKPDLLLATPAGPRLFVNESTPEAPKFTDVSQGLPQDAYFASTAAAAADFDGDGLTDILLGDAFSGVRYWRGIASPNAAKAPEVTLSKWKFIGPFDNADNRGYEAVYPPEHKLDFAAKYPGKGGFEAVWKEMEFPDGQLNSVKHFREDLHAFMTIYLHREITASTDCEVPVSMGNGGPIKLWVNGHLVFQENVQRTPAPDQAKATLRLKPGKNTLLMKCCYHASGRSYYFQHTPPQRPIVKLFEDASDRAGFGLEGIAGSTKVHHAAVADVDGDGKQDVVLSTTAGAVVARNEKGTFKAIDSGATYAGAGVVPVLADFNGDGKPDLIVATKEGCRLFSNAGGGKFADVTAASGALAQFKGHATSAALADMDGDGKPDLIVGVLRGPNRCFKGDGKGVFTDATESLGLHQRIFNSRAVSAIDFNNDRAMDVVFNNEGQESALLLGAQKELQNAE